MYYGSIVVKKHKCTSMHRCIVAVDDADDYIDDE
jgi:hypothetical protein